MAVAKAGGHGHDSKVVSLNAFKGGKTILLQGSEGDKSISSVDWADKYNSFPWEITCSFKNR